MSIWGRLMIALGCLAGQWMIAHGASCCSVFDPALLNTLVWPCLMSWSSQTDWPVGHEGRKMYNAYGASFGTWVLGWCFSIALPITCCILYYFGSCSRRVAAFVVDHV